jgi:uncharacterized protein
MSSNPTAEIAEQIGSAAEKQTLRKARAASKARTGRKVWIDLENSPHVPFFCPIMEELKSRGYEIVLTARDCFQVCELADMAGLEYRKVGRHHGKNRLAKLTGLGMRVLNLAPFIVRERPAISVSHCSRTSILLSSLLGIPSVNIIDYEFADQRLTGMIGSQRKKWVMTPEVVPSANFEKSGTLPDHILHYPGIKEDVYVPAFKPDPAFRRALGFAPDDVLVTLRPPASEAHYHSPESDRLLAAVFRLLGQHQEVKTVLLPRTPKQGAEIREANQEIFAERRIVIPDRALNGLDLIWHSDVVISGGGTMNREAAALHVPVYSIFRGALGAVDKHLAEKGKLILLKSEQDVEQHLQLARRDRNQSSGSSKSAALEVVVDHIETVCGSRG